MYAAYQKNQIASYIGAAWGYSMFRDNLPKQSGKWSIVPMPTWGRTPRPATGAAPPSRS